MNKSQHAAQTNNRVTETINVYSIWTFQTNAKQERCLHMFWGPFHKKILRLRYTLRTSSSSWRNTTSVIVSQQTIVMTTYSHYQGLVMLENTRYIKIMIFVKHIFAPVICLRLRSLLRFFVKRGPGPVSVRCLSGIYIVVPVDWHIATYNHGSSLSSEPGGTQC